MSCDRFSCFGNVAVSFSSLRRNLSCTRERGVGSILIHSRGGSVGEIMGFSFLGEQSFVRAFR